MDKPRTICANCAYCIVDLTAGPADKPRSRLDYRCKMVLHDRAIDPVTGKDVFLSHEAKFVTIEKHPNCVDMNPIGECAMYLGADYPAYAGDEE